MRASLQLVVTAMTLVAAAVISGGLAGFLAQVGPSGLHPPAQILLLVFALVLGLGGIASSLRNLRVLARGAGPTWTVLTRWIPVATVAGMVIGGLAGYVIGGGALQAREATIAALCTETGALRSIAEGLDEETCLQRLDACDRSARRGPCARGGEPCVQELTAMVAEVGARAEGMREPAPAGPLRLARWRHAVLCAAQPDEAPLP